MGVTQQPHAHGQPGGVAQVVLHEAEGAQVVGDFLDVVGVADGEAGFFVEEIGERGLRAFDLRGEQGFLADGAVEQPVDRGHEAGYAGEACQCQFRGAVLRGKRFGRKRRLGWRQRMRHKRAHRFAERGGGQVGAGGAHGFQGIL